MRELFLNGSDWRCKDDVYDDFFRAVGAPEWHGRNLDALNDSIAAGSINQIEVPYKLIVMNFDHVGAGALPLANDFTRLIRDLRAKGCPVEIELRGASGKLLP